MRTTNHTISIDRVRELLSYDPESGVFMWRVHRGGRANAGAVAGRLTSHGYIAIKIYHRDYLAHRLVWLIKTGEWPDREIDHRDHNRANNKWLNLRLATHNENQHNRAKNSASEFKGIYKKTPGRWCAQIRLNGINRYLGLFKTKEEAATAYAEAAKRLHGDFASA